MSKKSILKKSPDPRAQKKALNPADLAREWNPNSAATGSGIFGLPFSESQAELVILSAPFEATTSYLGGTSKAPARILSASHQVDLFHIDYPQVWRRGIAAVKPPKQILDWNQKAKRLATKARSTTKNSSLCERVNAYGDQLNRWVYQETKTRLEQNKKVGLIGGDHAVPFGAIKAHLEVFPKMGILHFDAHHDLRRAYEGFTWSHASIFYNVIEKLKPARITQVGIRDFCDEEEVFARKHTEIKVFRDRELAKRKFNGESWKSMVEEILETLPEEVYISFDIDGLEPAFCPTTGTPVPGGLSYNEVIFLLAELHRSKRNLVGFDLVEVGPQEWDANVASRLLYELSLQTLACSR